MPTIMPNSDPASQYTLLNKLGTGSFGTVYKALVHRSYAPLMFTSSRLECTMSPSRLSLSSRLVRLRCKMARGDATDALLALPPDLEDSDDDITEIQQEIAHLAQCDSEYVTRYYGSFVKGYKLWIGEPDLVGL